MFEGATGALGFGGLPISGILWHQIEILREHYISERIYTERFVLGFRGQGLGFKAYRV